MGSKYDISGGQQGAVGDSAIAHDFTMNANTAADNVDLKTLTEQLKSLRNAAMESATRSGDPDHVIAAGKIAAAEKAAASGDKQGALSHLKAAGEWALDLAKEIGASVTVELIKRQMNIG